VLTLDQPGLEKDLHRQLNVESSPRPMPGEKLPEPIVEPVLPKLSTTESVIAKLGADRA